MVLGPRNDEDPGFFYRTFAKTRAFMDIVQKEIYQETWNKNCFAIWQKEKYAKDGYITSDYESPPDEELVSDYVNEYMDDPNMAYIDGTHEYFAQWERF